MVTQSFKPAHSNPRTPSARAILRVWHDDQSIGASSARHYLQWIGRFRNYCSELGLDEVGELTHDGAKRFTAWYARSHKINADHLARPCTGIRSLRRVYEAMGTPLPPWRVPCLPQLQRSMVLRDYADHLRQHRGNPEVTIRKKLDHAGKLREHLGRVSKTWRQMSLLDIDAFLIECSRRYARSTTADLASAVISPVQPRFERPRRALPWEDVQKLLHAVDTSTGPGLRDHALLLMMSTYGLGAGEVIGLQLQDIDWDAGTLRMSRPKTGVNFVLPLLPAVAKVLARYLRHGRPPNIPTRHVFVQMKVPFGAFTASSAIRHILIKHAKVAGIQASYLGSHVLRHSNAARQVDVGTKTRVLSDLLGHRDPESVSAYVRIATQSLREVSLPVPR